METILSLPPQVAALIFFHQGQCTATADPVSRRSPEAPLPLELFQKFRPIVSCYYFTMRLGEVCKAWRKAIHDADEVWNQLGLLFGITASMYHTLIPLRAFYRTVCEEVTRAEIHRTISLNKQTALLRQWHRDNPNPCSISVDMIPTHPLFEDGPGEYAPPLSMAVTERIVANLDTLLFLLDTISRILKNFDGDARKTWRKQAKTRYRKFRLLKQQHHGLLLYPTADIEFVWVAHILHTEAYWADTGGLPHYILASPEHWPLRLAAIESTAALWEAAYGEPYLAANNPIPTQHVFTPTAGKSYWGPRDRPDFTPPASFLEVAGYMPGRRLTSEEKAAAPLGIRCPNLAELLKWQTPVNQILRFVSDLEEDEVYAPGHSVCAYQRFLYLASRNPKVKLEASYFVDAAWHAHQLNPVEYRQEVEAATGRFLKHDSQPGSKDLTESLWQRTFGLALDSEPKFADPDKFIPRRPWLPSPQGQPPHIAMFEDFSDYETSDSSGES